MSSYKDILVFSFFNSQQQPINTEWRYFALPVSVSYKSVREVMIDDIKTLINSVIGGDNVFNA